MKVTGADTFEVYGNTVKCVMVNREGPKAVPWQDLCVDFVIESTGWFVEADEAQGHIDAGAKRVIIFAPGKGALKTLVMGVNHTEYDKEIMNIGDPNFIGHQKAFLTRTTSVVSEDIFNEDHERGQRRHF